MGQGKTDVASKSNLLWASLTLSLLPELYRIQILADWDRFHNFQMLNLVTAQGKISLKLEFYLLDVAVLHSVGIYFLNQVGLR